jgi:hypothetical protein
MKLWGNFVLHNLVDIFLYESQEKILNIPAEQSEMDAVIRVRLASTITLLGLKNSDDKGITNRCIRIGKNLSDSPNC